MGDTSFEFGVTPFYFLRHGETRESRDGILQGQNESELNPRGRQMAETAAEALIEVQLGSIYASPLKRAWRTASIVSVLTGVPVNGLPGLMERHWGQYQGQHKTHRPSTPNPDSAESLEDFHNRILKAVRAIQGPSPVLFVAHSGVFRAICASVGISDDSRVTMPSGQVLKMEPPIATRRSWRISEVHRHSTRTSPRLRANDGDKPNDG